MRIVTLITVICKRPYCLVTPLKSPSHEHEELGILILEKIIKKREKLKTHKSRAEDI